MNSKLSTFFRTTLEATGTSPRWVIARVPIDLKKAWPIWKSRRVLGEINGFAFKTALIPGAKGQGHVLIVNKKMQAGARVRAGESALIKLAPDLGELVIDLPAEFAKILKGDRALKKWFDAMSPSMRKGFTNFIADAKSTGTRRKRAEAMAESLMLAMEGEVEPPPILRAAFQLQPEARRGWDSMTPTQRRNHLLGIFYPQTVEGRERRAAKAIESCLAVARRRHPEP
ncbi:MAG: YdeI/OmpD-associated family protein [Terracidiphilus sp.]